MLSPPRRKFSLVWLGLYGFFGGMDTAEEVTERPEADSAPSLARGRQVVDWSYHPNVWSPCYPAEEQEHTHPQYTWVPLPPAIWIQPVLSSLRSLDS